MLEKFFNGDCSPGQVEEIITSYYSGDLSDDIAEILKTYLNDPESAREGSTWDSKRLFEKITHEIYGGQVPVTKEAIDSSKDIKRPSLYPFWLKIAASVSVLLIISFFLIKKPYLTSPDQNPLSTAAYVVKSTSPSERLTVRLNDGSQVILNTGSKITYRKDFEPHQRIISLEGEAFFVVEKDKGRPFSVVTNGVVTTALGTSFNINTRLEEEGDVEIALIEGRVKIQAENETDSPGSTTLFLNPGEKLAIGTNGTRLSQFNIKGTVGWKDGIIYFDSVPFAEVIDILEKNYHVHFQVVYKDQKQKSQYYSGEFQNRSLEYILQNLSFSSDFTFEIEGDKIKILFK